MEEELNEHELEERLYAMLHHVDETQNNLNDSQKNKLDAIQLVENGPRSTLRRYWRTGPESNPNPYHKSNILKDSTSAPVKTPAQNAPKEEKSPPKPPSPVDLSIFQSPVPQNIKKTIEFLDNEEDKPVVLESSDEDEVVEVALPPKPTITIESSDDEDLHIVEKSPAKVDPKSNPAGERAVSASPVPSVVSSVSDEFIRGDCIALNISSRRPDKHSFDFSLHGSDLLGQKTNTSSKKRKRKKNKEAVTSTPIAHPENPANGDACFATPKSKAKNKRQKTKLFADKPERIMVYDSDSNMSSGDSNKNTNPYVVTEKSLPSVDVYESDSNQSEIVKEVNTDQCKDKYVIEDDSSDGNDNTLRETPRSSKKNVSLPDSSEETINLSDYDNNYITINDTGICDNIVIGNVTGFNESSDYGDENLTPSCKGDISKYVSSKIPSILNEDLDFDNLKGKEKICKKRRYSLTTLRAEMEKFYNESWGGEDFNHKEIQKYMSRDKSLWAIDPKDRMQSFAQRKSKCNYCNRVGHRDDTCRQKPPVCYMCGNAGHFEPRCPTKICVNCGSPNFMYSTMCRNCSGWGHMRCGECGQPGHPASHCPDIWRRYHNTINLTPCLETCTQSKKPYQMFCSGCARRGHLVHTCRSTIPFSGLPLNTPFVKLYRPIFTQPKTPRSKSFGEDYQRQDKNFNNKRLSQSPTVHDTHLNKKRNVSINDLDNTKSPVAAQKIQPKEVSIDNKNKRKSTDSTPAESNTEKAPDFITVSSSNHDNKGRVIQDNEVSDTSDVVTSARIYVTNDIINKFKTKEGEDWLKAATEKLNVTVGPADVNSFLSIKGKLADQEVFQTELRVWVQGNTNNSTNTTEVEETEDGNLLPKNKNNLLRQLNKALASLNEDLGDPRALYRELTFSQNKHEKLLKQRVISPKKLTNSRTHINNMLKKLNTILLGQAGLANGTEHLSELKVLKDMLLRSRQKNIAPSVRKEIGEHYNTIFSSIARTDYSELMRKYYADKNNKYYVANPQAKKARKWQSKVVLYRPEPNNTKNKSSDTNVPANNSVKPSIPSLANEIVVSAPSLPTPDVPAQFVPPPLSIPTLPNPTLPIPNLPKPNGIPYGVPTKGYANLLPKLFSCRDRLNHAKCATTKKSKAEVSQLLRRVHQCIFMLCQNKNITSKAAKKIKRAEEQAQKFLTKDVKYI